MLNAETRNWLMLWSVMGRPQQLPFKMLCMSPIEAFQTRQIFESNQNGVCFQLRYEAHPDFRNRYGTGPFVVKIWNYGSPRHFEKSGSLGAVLEIVRTWLVPASECDEH